MIGSVRGESFVLAAAPARRGRGASRRRGGASGAYHFSHPGRRPATPFRAARGVYFYVFAGLDRPNVSYSSGGPSPSRGANPRAGPGRDGAAVGLDLGLSHPGERWNRT